MKPRLQLRIVRDTTDVDVMRRATIWFENQEITS